MKPFHELLRDRIVELQSTDAEIARILTTERGIETSRQSVQQWSSGAHTPDAWKDGALLDALRIPEADRGPWRAALEEARRPDEIRRRRMSARAEEAASAAVQATGLREVRR